MEKKRCSKCKITQPVSQFNRKRATESGLKSWCKLCVAAHKREWRSNNPEKTREESRRRYEKNKNNPEYMKKVCARNKKSRDKYPEKSRCRCRFKRAKERGIVTIKSKCEYCGSRERIQAHHYDYNKPLSVVWLCVVCHRNLHYGKHDKAILTRSFVANMGGVKCS